MSDETFTSQLVNASLALGDISETDLQHSQRTYLLQMFFLCFPSDFPMLWFSNLHQSWHKFLNMWTCPEPTSRNPALQRMGTPSHHELYSIHFWVESRIPVVAGTIFMWAQSFAIFQLNTQTTDMNHQLMIPKTRKTWRRGESWIESWAFTPAILHLRFQLQQQCHLLLLQRSQFPHDILSTPKHIEYVSKRSSWSSAFSHTPMNLTF